MCFFFGNGVIISFKFSTGVAGFTSSVYEVALSGRFWYYSAQ